jgi:hypothetical protein
MTDDPYVHVHPPETAVVDPRIPEAMQAVRTVIFLSYASEHDMVRTVAEAVLEVADRWARPPVVQQRPAETLEDTARNLAEASRFPRYSGDRWELLLRSEADVETAWRHACDHDASRIGEFAVWRHRLLRTLQA